MKLRKLDVKNFKLLKDIRVEFSTDPSRPLTVIRAENGSGKTSVLYALLWGFYGAAGLPRPDANTTLRLSSTRWPAGKACEISVRIEFEATEVDTYAGDDQPSTTWYVLTRTVTETPKDNDEVSAQREVLVVHAHSDAGADRLEDAAARALIRRHAPEHLKDIFFTDGDSVQRFITGELGAHARQKHVRDAIKALLGLDQLRTAERDLTKARTTFRQRRASAPGADELKRIEDAIEAAQGRQGGLKDQSAALAERINNVSSSIQRREDRLNELRHLGELEKIRDRRETAQRTLKAAGAALEGHKRAQRELLRSDGLSWDLMGSTLQEGLGQLQGLADQRIIPGTSLEVLRDRLDLGECICGESLAAGSAHRSAVESLVDAQASVDQRKEMLTALLHQARHHALGRESSVAEGRTWLDSLTDVEQQRAATERQIRDQTEELKACDDALRRLEDADIDRLLDSLERERKLRESYLQDERELALGLQDIEARLRSLETDAGTARSQSRISRSLDDKVDVAEDLLRLIQETLIALEGDYLRLASDRMNVLFMEIVGATSELDRSVFTEVRLTAKYEIEVLSGHEGRTLDTDFEINGASKRALTLAFIWALMEVAEVSAARIIDTPLGMMAGGVKRRFVDLLTKPGKQDFQVVLLMTRSEIATVEDLIDERGGRIQTLSCSKDYPVDLVNDWGGQEPIVEVCECTHRQSCDLCARRDDAVHHLEHRLGAEVPS